MPKITDFGLAKRTDTDDGFTESGQIMGSPSYMAPEQARGNTKDVGPAAVTRLRWSAMFYEMLTGAALLLKGNPRWRRSARASDDDDPAKPPSRLVPRLPRDLGDNFASSA